MFFRRHTTTVVLLACLVAPPVAADTLDHLITRTHRTMGTTVSIAVWAEDDARAAEAIAAAFAELDRVDRLMTTWLPASDVSRINDAAGSKEPVQVDPEVIRVLGHARRFARLTGGAFDITVGAFRGLWKFDEDRDGTIPSPAEVRQRTRLVNWRDVRVNRRRNTARLARRGQRITLGGIAKGWGTDRAVAVLHERGFVHFMVQAGGDLYVSGRRGDRKWRVGIRDPRGQASDFFAHVEVEDRTFSTSGDYERAVVTGGKRYHHILDPDTGHPAMRSRSVTVMAKDALTADALSTALFVMGHVRGMRLVERLPDVEAVFVAAEGSVHVSSGLEPLLTVHHAPTGGL